MNDTAAAAHGNRYNTGPTVALTAGELRGAWNNGVFAGDPEMVTWATMAAEANAEVQLFGRTFTCGSDTSEGAFAAMGSYSPGRVIVTEAPEEVLVLLEREGALADIIDATRAQVA